MTGTRAAAAPYMHSQLRHAFTCTHSPLRWTNHQRVRATFVVGLATACVAPLQTLSPSLLRALRASPHKALAEPFSVPGVRCSAHAASHGDPQKPRSNAAHTLRTWCTDGCGSASSDQTRCAAVVGPPLVCVPTCTARAWGERRAQVCRRGQAKLFTVGRGCVACCRLERCAERHTTKDHFV